MLPTLTPAEESLVREMIFEMREMLAEAEEDLLQRVENLVTEDDTPVDNIFSERQQRLLTESLYSSWQRPVDETGAPRKFLALANVGVFPMPEQEAVVVPDVLVSMDVALPADVKPKRYRSYFLWEYGKPPDVVIEIVSNKKGEELTEKKLKYHRMRVPCYVVYDPLKRLSDRELTVYEWEFQGYQPQEEQWLPVLGLGLTIVEGEYEGVNDRWLRWSDAAGNILETGGERAEREAERAKHEAGRAEHEAERAHLLAAKLREMGIDPDKL